MLEEVMKMLAASVVLPDDEKEAWFDLLPRMNDEQLGRLKAILEDEIKAWKNQSIDISLGEGIKVEAPTVGVVPAGRGIPPAPKPDRVVSPDIKDLGANNIWKNQPNSADNLTGGIVKEFQKAKLDLSKLFSKDEATKAQERTKEEEDRKARLISQYKVLQNAKADGKAKESEAYKATLKELQDSKKAPTVSAPRSVPYLSINEALIRAGQTDEPGFTDKLKASVKKDEKPNEKPGS